MQLIFDDLQELKEFISEFLGNSPAQNAAVSGNVAVMEKPKASATVAVPEISPVAAPRRGRPPKAAETAQPAPSIKPAPAAKPSAKAAATVSAPRRRDGATLTDRIRTIIDKFIENGTEFSANSVYDEIYKKDKEVNKQSVITSVLKQMTTNYTNVKWEERQGNGPRNIKMYNVK